MASAANAPYPYGDSGCPETVMLLKSAARILVKYAGNAAGFGVAGDALLELWDVWNKETPDRQQKLAEVQQLAEQSADETRQLAQTLAQEVAADQPETVRQAVASYLTQVPAMVRRSLKRPADPTGKTLPPGLLFGKPEDLLELLPAKPARFKPGDTPPGIGDWELVELLGVGGFGEVWLAHNPTFDGVPPVALKFCTNTEAAKSLEHEAAVLNQVMRQGKHRGIVQLQHTYRRTDPPCLEYEYVAGGDLTGLIHDRHRAPGGCSLLAMTDLIAQLAEIIGFAHRLTPPIVHRDLKPANILVSQLPGVALQLKVADFGIGGIAADQALKDAKGRPTSYVTAMATGTCTPLYASPQQQAGRPADPRDDVYSISVIWYQALTGDLSAGRPGGAAWRRKLVEQGLPMPVVELLDSCFEDDPDNRPRDAADLAERLKALLPPVAAGAKKAQTVYPPAKIRPTPQAAERGHEAAGPQPVVDGHDLSTGEGLASYVKQSLPHIKFTDLQLKKLAAANPKGLTSGTVIVPRKGVSGGGDYQAKMKEALGRQQEMIEALKVVLPVGTKLVPVKKFLSAEKLGIAETPGEEGTLSAVTAEEEEEEAEGTPDANVKTTKNKATAEEVLAAWKNGGPPPTLNKPQILVLKTLDALRGQSGLTRREIAARIEAEGVKLVEHRVANESYTYALLQGGEYIEEGGVGAEGEQKKVFRITPAGREAYAAAMTANTEVRTEPARAKKEGLRVPQVKILRFLATANSEHSTFSRDEIALGITEKEGGKTAIGDALGRVDKEARERSDVANYPSLISLGYVEMVEMADPDGGRPTIRYRITQAGREALKLAE
jgi:serine/threonine protein kinase/DNA-binding PadR family transcriptional regulator